MEYMVFFNVKSDGTCEVMSVRKINLALDPMLNLRSSNPRCPSVKHKTSR